MSNSCDPWTIAHQAPLSIGFLRQESWSGLPFLSRKNLPDPGIEPASLALQADSLLSEPLGKLSMVCFIMYIILILSYFLFFYLHIYAYIAAKSFQLCLTLCDPIDGSPPGSAISGILQARTLEWVAISFSNAWKWKVKVKSLSRVRLFVTPWAAAHQAPPSMGFSRQEYWGGVPLPYIYYHLIGVMKNRKQCMCSIPPCLTKNNCIHIFIILL